MPAPRFEFEKGEGGELLDTATNVVQLRRLWLDRHLVSGDGLGPGNPGDFDHGAWHVSCHLTGAGGVLRLPDGALVWVEISHDAARDVYYASATFRQGGALRTVRLDSASARGLLGGARVAGYVEGTSTGRVSCDGVGDPPDRFNLWRRQDFDQPVDAPVEGGKVWEHWCTLRDLRPACAVATSVVSAYVSLVSVLGDRFVALVARGRRTYGHPVQLRAMVRAGLVAEASALAEVQPLPLPAEASALLQAARPGPAFEAVSTLDWGGGLRYYMFQRKIAEWSRAEDVRKDLAAR